MINVQSGFIITENCFKCKKTSTYFSYEDRPPLEEYRQGDHFMNVMGSVQSIRFDLKCTVCNRIITLDELCGLMLCTGCDEKCRIYTQMKELEKERTWIYIALGFLPHEEKKQISEEKIAVLEEYFNQRRKSSRSRIKILADTMIDNMSLCLGETIRDAGMLSLQPPDNE
jgi:hypothetical protein